MKPILYTGIELEEIINVLLSIFSSSKHYDNTTIFCPGGDYNEHIIQIKISEKNEIRLIPSPKCDSNTLQRIKEKIRTDIYECEPKIGRDILFSSHIPLYGYFRYKDVFQIIPATTQAPRPEYMTWPQPILLEFTYDKSNNGFIDIYRRNKNSCEIAWLLNLLLNADISSREYLVSKQWVRCDGEVVSRLCNTEYVFEDFKRTADTFSDTSAIEEIKLIDAREYYGRGQDVSEGLRGPKIINELLDIVYRLDKEQYNHLMTACKFLSLSSKLWNSSQSMAYLAAISAIESIPKDSSYAICRECGKPKNGPTKRFKDFLEKYGPKSSITNKIRDELYGLRSAITHRGFLFERDSNPYTFIGSPKTSEQEKKGIALRQIVQISLVRWLIDISKSK